MEPQEPARGVCRLALVGLALLAIPSPAAAQEPTKEQWRTGLHWSIAASVACDALDLHSTYYVLDRRTDAAEANFLYGDIRDTKKAIAIKAAGSVALTAVAVAIHDDFPLPSLLLTTGNAILKCGFAIRHYRLARDAPSRRASLALLFKLTF